MRKKRYPSKPGRAADREPPRRPPHRQPNDGHGPTEIVYGLRACQAILSRRPNDVLRIAIDPAIGAEGDAIARRAAPSTELSRLSSRDLERIAGTNQHEGVCIEVAARRWMPLAEVADLLVREGGTAIALDRVRNPYNVGAILRSAAFFGTNVALLGAPAPHPALDPLAVRVAEGGTEHLALARTTDLADTLSRLRLRDIRVVGADGAAEMSAFDEAFRRPTVLVLGNEREGMSPRVRAQCDAIIALRGTGNVESLNVGVAAGILVAELARKNRSDQSRPRRERSS